MSENQNPRRRFVINEAVVFSHSFPLNVTKASDTIIAICNRNDTPHRIGERVSGPDTPGYFIPMSRFAMAEILGDELGKNFLEAIKDPACAEYYRLVTTRLTWAGVAIAYSNEFWLVCKVPHLNGVVDPKWMYTIGDLDQQGPAGTTSQP